MISFYLVNKKTKLKYSSLIHIIFSLSASFSGFAYESNNTEISVCEALQKAFYDNDQLSYRLEAGGVQVQSNLFATERQPNLQQQLLDSGLGGLDKVSPAVVMLSMQKSVAFSYFSKRQDKHAVITESMRFLANICHDKKLAPTSASLSKAAKTHLGLIPADYRKAYLEFINAIIVAETYTDVNKSKLTHRLTEMKHNTVLKITNNQNHNKMLGIIFCLHLPYEKAKLPHKKAKSLPVRPSYLLFLTTGIIVQTASTENLIQAILAARDYFS